MRKELVIPHYNTLLNIYFFGTTRIAQAHTEMGGSIPPLSGLCFSMTTRNASSVVPPPRSSTFEQAADNKGTGHRESTRSAMTDIKGAEKRCQKALFTRLRAVCYTIAVLAGALPAFDRRI